MDEQLRAELESVYQGMEDRMLSQIISRDVDMALLADGREAIAVKSMILAPVLQQPSSYVTAVLVSVIRKTRAMVQGIFDDPVDFHVFHLDHDETESGGYQRAHVLLTDLLTSSDEGVGPIAERLEADVSAMELKAKGQLMLHTFTLCNGLLDHVVGLRDRQLTDEWESTGGDSDS